MADTATKASKPTRDRDALTRREVAEFACVPLSAVDKAIEQKVVRPRTADRVLLSTDDLAVVSLLQEAGVPLPVVAKRRVGEWVYKRRPHRSRTRAELALSGALVIRCERPVSEAARRAERYIKLRDRFITSDPEIKGGKPVIRGTRLGIRAIAQRVADGEKIEVMLEDYPHVPREAFDAALIYARTHPRQGRPARPWHA